MRPISNIRAGLALFSLFATSHAAPPTLDLSNGADLIQASGQALSNLLKYYSPNKDGTFDVVQTPWHESGMIWNTFYDWAKYTGDFRYQDLVTSALVNLSYGTQQDFLNGAQAESQGLLGKWNDDILWPAQAIIAGAEIQGAENQMPGAGGDWIVAPQKTLDQVYSDGQRDDTCGGGIYWSRNRQAADNDYKSVITHLEYIQTAARVYIQTQNETLIQNSQTLLAWLFNNGLGDLEQGLIYDGVSASNCYSITGSQWSYNYGQLIGALAWMHKATGNATYLDMASPFVSHSLSIFAPNGVIEELCEPAGTCNRDQQGFKAIYVRNLAYLVRETTNQNDIDSIKNAIETSVKSMIQHSCDEQWNCGGNWTLDSGSVLYVRSQHVSAALLVASAGMFQEATGPGLLPANLNAPQISGSNKFNVTTGALTSKCTTTGSVTSCPLDGAAKRLGIWDAGVLLALALIGLSLYT